MLKNEQMPLTGEGQSNSQGTNAEEQDVKTYTQEDVDKMVESMLDKRVTQALKTARSKWEEETTERIEQERQEAEKIAKMTAQERAEAQLAKDREHIEKEKKALLAEKLEVSTRKQLRAEGLCEDFATFLMHENEETTKERIEEFKKEFNEQVEKSVKEKLKGSTPISGKDGQDSLIHNQIADIFGF